MTKHNTDCNCNYCKHIEKCVLVHDEIREIIGNIEKICIGFDTTYLGKRQRNQITLIFQNIERIKNIYAK